MTAVVVTALRYNDAHISVTVNDNGQCCDSARGGGVGGAEGARASPPKYF